jgi:putative ABC transport system ATP-binding protein
MGAPDVLRRPVTELSVGQQQRVAAARALIGAPELVIADEPTSSLDADRRAAFIDLLFGECARERATLIFVSHDATLAPLFDRSMEFVDINRSGASEQDASLGG